jgi:hypothetical protein
LTIERIKAASNYKRGKGKELDGNFGRPPKNSK